MYLLSPDTFRKAALTIILTISNNPFLSNKFLTKTLIYLQSPLSFYWIFHFVLCPVYFDSFFLEVFYYLLGLVIELSFFIWLLGLHLTHLNSF